MHVYTYIHIYVYMYIYMFICIYIYIYIFMHAYLMVRLVHDNPKTILNILWQRLAAAAFKSPQKIQVLT